jgi:hypothetical protein
MSHGNNGSPIRSTFSQLISASNDIKTAEAHAAIFTFQSNARNIKNIDIINK